MWGRKKVLSEVLYWLVFVALEIVTQHSELKQQTLFLTLLGVGWVFSPGLAGPAPGGLGGLGRPHAHDGGSAPASGDTRPLPRPALIL